MRIATIAAAAASMGLVGLLLHLYLAAGGLDHIAVSAAGGLAVIGMVLAEIARHRKGTP